MKVWAIFSIADNYDQPDNNLEKLYRNKPTFEQILFFLHGETPLEDLEEYQLIDIVNMLQGKETEFKSESFRLEEVEVSE